MTDHPHPHPNCARSDWHDQPAECLTPYAYDLLVEQNDQAESLREEVVSLTQQREVVRRMLRLPVYERAQAALAAEAKVVSLTAERDRLQGDRDALAEALNVTDQQLDELRQAAWDALTILGMDTDGNDTPDHLSYPPLEELLRDQARSFRGDLDAATTDEAQAWSTQQVWEDKAKAAEAEVTRLRTAIAEHRERVQHIRCPDDDTLWSALDGES